ncbi:hypothetical protein LTR17_004554 [Elasticomyces elasticus]|nr:hypothetical protein LTR17_004554 [Elasticomyces elasticus]
MLPEITGRTKDGVTGPDALENTSRTPLTEISEPVAIATAGQHDPNRGSVGVIADESVPHESPYLPLGFEYDTRLITLKRPTYRGPIECTLRRVAFRDKPEYGALSYNWGSGTPDREIRLNGRKIWIRKTLYDALRVLIYHKVDTLWVDNLCIDQGCQTDKGQQVAIMHHIYSRASRVYAWLGPSRSKHDGSNGELGLRTLANLPIDKVDLVDWAKTQTQSKEYKGVVGLINRDYWTRSWIIQELSKARQARILCGKEILDVVVFFDHLFSLSDWIWSSVPFALRDHIHCLRAFLEQEQTVSRRPQMSLVTAIILGRHSQTSLPRDKIYAFTHFGHDGGKLVEKYNYFQSDNAVFEAFTENLINIQGHASVMIFARRVGVSRLDQISPSNHHSRPRVLKSSISSTVSADIQEIGVHSTILKDDDDCWVPTWVPAWSALDDPLPSWIMDSVLKDENTIIPPSRDLHCTHGKLTIRGAQLAVIQALSGCHYEDGQTNVLIYEASASDESCNLEVDSQYTANEVAMNLWRAVVQFNDPLAPMGLTCDKQLCHAQGIVGYGLARVLTAEHRSPPNFQSNEALIDRWVENNSHLPLGTKTLGQWMNDICEQARSRAKRSPPASFMRDSQIPAECSSDFATESKLFAEGLRTLEKSKMRLAFTTAGNFEAVYREAKVRDLIYRLQQVSLPVVLRKKITEDYTSFRYIGEVYLRDHLKPSAIYTNHTWRDVESDNPDFRPITID